MLQDLCKSLEDECSIQPVKLQLSTDATVKQVFNFLFFLGVIFFI